MCVCVCGERLADYYIFPPVNLYGYCLSQQLPISDFTWESLTINQVKEIVSRYKHETSKKGYLIECDLEIPEHLHDLFADYPPIPEKLKLTYDMISPWSKLLLGQTFTEETKLCPNLFNKIKYICHIQNLQLYLELGILLKKVHRVVSFRQSYWLKTYIDFNSKKRAESKTAVEKSFFKLLINSIYGKFLQSSRNYRKFYVSRSRARSKRLFSKSTFKDIFVLDTGVTLFEMKPVVVWLDKPIFVGVSCLELAKHFMVDFFYNRLIKHFGRKRVTLMYTDTDSMILYFTSVKDLFKELVHLKSSFDFSSYPTNSPLYNIENKNVPGKFRDERPQAYIKEVVCLRAKCYSILDNVTESRAAAGVKSAVQKLLTHEDYKDVLFNSKTKYVTQQRFGSESHKVFTYDQRKAALSGVDIKRYQANCIISYPYGHYLLTF